MIKDFIDIIREDPKAAIIDLFVILGMFAGWLGLYFIIACFL